MLHPDVQNAVARLVTYHSSHHPDGAPKTNFSLSRQSNDSQLQHSACNNTIAELIRLGGVPLRPLRETPPTAMVYKAESARLSLELTLWKDFKSVQQRLPEDELCRSIDTARAIREKWCEEDLVDPLKQYFDFKAYQVYHFWILETVMQMAKEPSKILQPIIESGSLDDAEAIHYGKTAEEWIRLFDLYHVIADATRATICEIEQVALNLSTDLATRAGSKKRFGDVKNVFRKFAATVAARTVLFAGTPWAADRTSIGASTFAGTLGALDSQISFLMNWAVSWDLASQKLTGFMANPTVAAMQQRMLGWLKKRAYRFLSHSQVWQDIVAHIEGKMLDLLWEESAGNALPATLHEELERAKKAAMGNLSASWAMEQRVRMTRVQFNELNRGIAAPTQQGWASAGAGSSKSGHFFPEARLFRPAMDAIAASTERPAAEGGNAAQRQATPDVDDLPDYEDFEEEDAAASAERPANKDGNAAPRQPTPDIDDLPDYEDFEDDEGVWPTQNPEASTERPSMSPSPPPPSDQAEHPGTAAEDAEEDDARSPRYSLSPSPPPAPPSPANDQPGPPATNARNASPPASPTNKRKRSASPPDEEEEDASRSPRQSPTPSPPPPKRARSSSPAHSPSPAPSKTPSPPPAPPSPSHDQAAADVGNAPPAASLSPSHNQAAADVGNAPPAASPSNKRKRPASPPEEEEDDEAEDNRSPIHSPTPSPPPTKRARSTSPAPEPSPPKPDTEAEDDEPEGSSTTKGKGNAAAPAGATKTGRVTKPRAPYKKKDYRAAAEANGGVRRSARIKAMKKG